MNQSPVIEIRPAREDDLEACAALAVANNGFTIERWVDALGKILVREDAAMFVAHAGSDVVAYGKLQWHDWSDDPVARNVPPGFHLSGVIVDPSWRRRGIGADLVRVRTDWLAERHPGEPLWYCTNARNAASLRLHQQFGFAEVTRDFAVPKLHFEGGRGVLSRRDPAAPDR